MYMMCYRRILNPAIRDILGEFYRTQNLTRNVFDLGTAHGVCKMSNAQNKYYGKINAIYRCKKLYLG